MDVWRIENTLGIGPYHGGGEVDLSSHNNVETHPTPRADAGIERWPEEDERCAFASMEDLKRWFTTAEIKALADAGYHIKRKRGVVVTAYGDRQVLYKEALHSAI